MYRRSRAPNPSVVLYAQRDGFNERVLGGGLAIPIVLPPRSAAPTAARSPRARRSPARPRPRPSACAARSAGRGRRRRQDLKARRAELAAFDPRGLQRAEAHLLALGLRRWPPAACRSARPSSCSRPSSSARRQPRGPPRPRPRLRRARPRRRPAAGRCRSHEPNRARSPVGPILRCPMSSPSRVPARSIAPTATGAPRGAGDALEHGDARGARRARRRARRARRARRRATPTTRCRRRVA
jgi:hypothetical protein